jgi:hypothetical protein
MTKTNIATVDEKLPLPAEMLDDMLQHEGEGTSYDASEMVIPFIRIAQKLTPHIDKKKPEFIPGLEEGDLYNTVTREFWKGEEGLDFVIAYQKTALLTFVPRVQGGGFRGEISPDDPMILQARRDENNREMLPNGLELVRSDQHFGLALVAPGVYAPAVIDMKSTARKVSARLKTQINLMRVKHPATGKMIRPPIFSMVWSFKTVSESNDKGDFYNYGFVGAGLVQDSDLYQEAKLFRESILAGRVTTAPEDHPESAGQNSPGHSGEDEIPF